MKLSRRQSLLTGAGVIASLALGLPFAAVRSTVATLPRRDAVSVDEGYKVGPVPALPPLPPRPYPNARHYLFANGTVSIAQGYLVELQLSNFARQGFARSVPFGLDISTNERKLWLLGRKTFAPPLTAEAMKVHANDPFEGSGPAPACGHHHPVRFDLQGRLVPDALV